MKVIITEKETMNEKYKKALINENNIIIVNSVGHLEKLKGPEEYCQSDPFSKEDYNNGEVKWHSLVKRLPLIPEKYELKITKQNIYEKIKQAVKNAEEIILACDPDREGEVIHRNILELLKEEHIIKTDRITRVWLNSETEKGIRDAFNKRQNFLVYDGFYRAAKIRAIVDWLVGIQLTVLYSTKYGKGALISIGRVQSWLLSEIVKRAEQFYNFIPKDYWTIQFLTKDGIPLNLTTNEWKVKQIFDQQEYDKIFKNIIGKPLHIDKIETKPFIEYAPNLYDLSDLSKDASKKYNISPEKTLMIAQNLYETHEIISYPRTDCNVISEEEAKELHKSLSLLEMFPEYIKLVKHVKHENPTIAINKKYVGKIQGHYAIIPVLDYSKKTVPKLSSDEQKIFDLIIKRFVSALLPPIKGEKTIIKGNIETNLFYTEIKNIKDYGYKKYLTDEEDDKEEKIFSINYKENENIEGKSISKKNKTKPEPLFKDDGIMTLMEQAHLVVRDEKLKVFLKDAKGIGTAATRASFIPKLLKLNLIVKEKYSYIPTQKGKELFTILPEELKVADYSAKLEYELYQYIKNQGRPEKEIISETEQFLKKIFEKVKEDNFKFTSETYGNCPKCGKKMIMLTNKEKKQFLSCEDKECKTYLDIKGNTKTVAGKLVITSKGTEKIQNQSIEIETNMLCSECNSRVYLKKGEFGYYGLCKREDKSKGHIIKIPKSIGIEKLISKMNNTGAKILDIANDIQSEINKPKVELKTKPCPKCGGIMTLRNGAKGNFWGCNNWDKPGKSKCTNTENLDESGNVIEKKSKPCPECEKKGNNGELILKEGISSKSGKNYKFWSCTNWNKTGKYKCSHTES